MQHPYLFETYRRLECQETPPRRVQLSESSPFSWRARRHPHQTSREMTSEFITRVASGKETRRSCVLRSNDVIFATRCKNIDYEGVFQGRGAVFDSTTDRETVTGSNVECFSLTSDFQMSANDVDNLVVGVAVGTASPTSGHLVLGEEEVVVVGHHLSRETRFRF